MGQRAFQREVSYQQVQRQEGGREDGTSSGQIEEFSRSGNLEGPSGAFGGRGGHWAAPRGTVMLGPVLPEG